MRRGIPLSVLLFCCVSCFVHGVRTQAYLDYISQWEQVALEQQEQYGIPACITLAQALLESSAGKSELAVNANNHFGIKCTSDWLGDVYRHDDDKKNECFRVYTNAAESFKDHSLFLQRPRYQRLFNTDMSDYKAWAHGLKDCGYATDPFYPSKLINIIEEYELFCGEGLPTPEQYTPPTSEQNKQQLSKQNIQQSSEQNSIPNKSTAQKPVVVSKPDHILTVHSDPQLEYQEPRTRAEEKKLFLLLHKKMRQNGCSYVVAQEGDTYANIAFRLNVKERTLRIWNDALDRDLQSNDRVYLMSKKKYAPKEKTIMWVHPDETLWFISQREGIKISTIYKLNGLDRNVRVFKTRQQILLRKPQKEK